MKDPNLDKLIEQDQQLGADTAAQAGTGKDDTDIDTDINEGLRLLHRVRNQQAAWPLGDETLEQPQRNVTPGLIWGSADTAPQTLGRFEIKGELGRGGFGIVLRAGDPKLQRDVALKIPRAETMLSAEARERMAREARAATILAHPAIVPVYEVGEFGSVTYISYGLCGEDTLADWIAANRSRITPQLAAKIVSRLSEAVQHAHARSIVHRDLKPVNVLLDIEASADHIEAEADHKSQVSVDDLVASLRIADFGLAKMDTAKSDVTRTGAPLGTPAYMSPEQARGDATVGAESDVFSLGVILYELLTGCVPFRRDTDLATLRAIENDAPAPIPRDAAPKDLVAVCGKCLQKRAEDRYQTAQRLHGDLQRFLRGEPVSARSIGPMPRLSRWCNRNRALAASLTTLLAVLITATLFSSIMWHREQSARTLSEANEQRAAQSADEARQQASALQTIVRNLLVELTHVPADDAKALTPLLNNLLGSYHDQIKNQDSDDKVIQENHFTTLEHLATIHRNLGNNHRAAELFEEALAYTRKRRPDEFGRHAYFLGLMSAELRSIGDSERATQFARQSVDIQRQAIANGDGPHCTRNLLIAYLANLCEIIDDQNLEEAEVFINEAIELASDKIGKAPSGWPPRRLWNALLNDKVKVCARTGNLEETQSFAEIGIRNVSALLPNDRSYSLNQLAAIYGSLALVHFKHDDFAAAEAHYRTSLQHAEELAGRHPQLGAVQTIVPDTVNELARVLISLESIDQARRLLEANLVAIEEGQDQFPQLEFEWKRAADRAQLLLSEL